jgi:hypothetical protein
VAAVRRPAIGVRESDEAALLVELSGGVLSGDVVLICSGSRSRFGVEALASTRPNRFMLARHNFSLVYKRSVRFMTFLPTTEYSDRPLAELRAEIAVFAL